MTRRDYTQTDELIKTTYLDLLKEKKKMPTQEAVAEKCNITRKTVNLHLNKIELPNIHRPYKIFGDNVLLALYAKALKGDVLAIKLFLSLVYEWNEKQEVRLADKDGNALKVQFEFVNPKKKDKEDEHTEQNP